MSSSWATLLLLLLLVWYVLGHTESHKKKSRQKPNLSWGLQAFVDKLTNTLTHARACFCTYEQFVTTFDGTRSLPEAGDTRLGLLPLFVSQRSASCLSCSFVSYLLAFAIYFYHCCIFTLSLSLSSCYH